MIHLRFTPKAILQAFAQEAWRNQKPKCVVVSEWLSVSAVRPKKTLLASSSIFQQSDTSLVISLQIQLTCWELRDEKLQNVMTFHWSVQLLSNLTWGPYCNPDNDVTQVGAAGSRRRSEKIGEDRRSTRCFRQSKNQWKPADGWWQERVNVVSGGSPKDSDIAWWWRGMLWNVARNSTGFSSLLTLYQRCFSDFVHSLNWSNRTNSRTNRLNRPTLRWSAIRRFTSASTSQPLHR